MIPTGTTGKSSGWIPRVSRRPSTAPRRQAEVRVRSRSFAYLAAALAFCSAAISVFWTLGGTFLLDTVGGSLEDLARSRSPAAAAVGAATSLTKLGAGVLALALVRPAHRRVPDRMLVGANAVLAALLLAWGGANVVVGSLSLAGAVSPADGIDERALLWHVLVWDLWFVVWGAALTGAIVLYRRARPRDGGRQHRAAHAGPGQPGLPDCPAQDEGAYPYRRRRRQVTLATPTKEEAHDRHGIQPSRHPAQPERLSARADTAAGGR